MISRIFRIVIASMLLSLTSVSILTDIRNEGGRHDHLVIVVPVAAKDRVEPSAGNALDLRIAINLGNLMRTHSPKLVRFDHLNLLCLAASRDILTPDWIINNPQPSGFCGRLIGSKVL